MASQQRKAFASSASRVAGLIEEGPETLRWNTLVPAVVLRLFVEEEAVEGTDEWPGSSIVRYLEEQEYLSDDFDFLGGGVWWCLW